MSCFVMTVTGTNKQSKFPFFPSRGPIVTSKGKTYTVPEVIDIINKGSGNPGFRRAKVKIVEFPAKFFCVPKRYVDKAS